MIWFAQLAMNGRFQAIALVMLSVTSAFFSWLGAAVVGLVTLRKGAGEGGFLLLWGFLGGVFLYVKLGDVNPIMQISGTFFLAVILRRTVNLAVAVLACVPLGIILVLFLLWLSPPMIDQVVAAFSELISSLNRQMENSGRIFSLEPPGERLVIGMIGVANLATAILCLFLARFWQAALYNPGKFGVEFRVLRYPPLVTFPLAIGFALVSSMQGYQSWAGFFGLPLTVAGISLVHAKAQYWKAPTLGLSLFYLVWLIVDWVKLGVLLLAVVDSAYDFRGNWSKGNMPERNSQNDEKSNDL